MRIDARTPTEYIAKLDEPRKSEIQQLHELIRQTVPRLKPLVMAGMLGYGKFHYKYASGREGDWSVIQLASQKNYISLYACAVEEKTGKYVAEKYKDKLPKANIGKSCIRFKRMADVDLNVIRQILHESETAARQPG